MSPFFAYNVCGKEDEGLAHSMITRVEKFFAPAAIACCESRFGIDKRQMWRAVLFGWFSKKEKKEKGLSVSQYS